MIDTSNQGDMGIQEGGMRKREKPLAKDTGVSGYICYIIVAAIDEALGKITQHGRVVTTPKVLILAGYFAYALDTEGNPFAVWEVAE
jgi:predicted enzyme related to lactoylglutathione lyase